MIAPQKVCSDPGRSFQVHSLAVDRLNSEGILRSRLIQVLRQPLEVSRACKMDACLLCRHRHVNAAGLCDACYTQLTEPEMAIAHRWLTGEGP